MRRCLTLLGLLLTACDGGEKDADQPTDEEPTTGALALYFTIDPDVQETMAEDAIGAFRGSIFLADDVTAVGPVDGAEDLESVFVEEVDLRNGASAVLYTTGQLPVGWITVLGFLDTDGNADPDNPDPDDKDPVTLPHQNELEVIGGETTEVAVHFGLLKP